MFKQVPFHPAWHPGPDFLHHFCGDTCGHGLRPDLKSDIAVKDDSLI